VCSHDLNRTHFFKTRTSGSEMISIKLQD